MILAVASTESPIEFALHNATTDPTDEHRALVVREFGGARLFIAVREPVQPVIDGAGRLLESLTVPMLTGDGPHGRVLLVFTSEAELRKRSAQAHPLSLAGRTVRDIVARDGMAGVVLNPAGSWMFLASADLATAAPDSSQP
jgi:hypothetical protein